MFVLFIIEHICYAESQMDFDFSLDDLIKENDLILDTIPFQLDDERSSLKRTADEMDNSVDTNEDTMSMPVYPNLE